MGEEATVANPYRAALVRLRDSLKQETEELRKSLGKASEDMGSKKVWVGPTADNWQKDVEGRHARVKTLVDKLIPAVNAAIAQQDEKVTPGAARAMQVDLRMR